jgi:DNA-binding IclR family transcriptional regulator
VTGPAPGSADGEPSDLVRSVSRALRVLEAVGTSKSGVNAKTVARRCGLHLSTAYHLLRTLCYEGYLVRGPGGDYTLGLEIAERFHDLAAALSQPPRVASVLRRLAGHTGHSAYLGRFVDGRVAVTQVVDGPGSPHLEDLLVGFHDAAHATALGKAMLSTLPPQRRQAYLQNQGMVAFTERTTLEPAELEQELARGHDDGVFVEEGQFRPGVACVATVVTPVEAPDLCWAVALSTRRQAFAGRRGMLVAGLARAAAQLRCSSVPPESTGLAYDEVRPPSQDGGC